MSEAEEIGADRGRPVARTYSHRRREDLLALRSDLASLTPTQRACAVTYCLDSGLMGAHLWLRLSLRLFRWRFGHHQGGLRFVNFLAGRASALEPMWAQVMAHMTDGRDAYDRLSAGGWCKRELDAFIEYIFRLGWKPPATN